ncbi:DHHA1 domain-containing protein [Schinkia azotoformans]|uniref:Alanine--tRNA ligase n=2 Tax=Schinkia azotoformans TaxID=1454 RepID=K6D7R9_SCHAZ|nr:alanyl-tRNA synthetase [Schinkia azotoformans LMG 9581]MED4352102.1 DHHA1 domain-containing protein [Schinkia azotoformans]
MATEKLYYQNQYIRSFTASLQKSDKDEQGRFYVVLDQTAFYPTGGGQPHDTGMINGVNVVDVEEVDGEIRHYIEKPIEAQKEFLCEINWERRFDHMQQHSGQHILSAAFDHLFSYKTVSFHLGKEICTIDIETTNLSEDEALQAEKLANSIIQENRPIEAKWVRENELENYSLRKELSVLDNIRLVIIPDFDYNGCGGTHPKATGEVSAVKILHWEKQKKNIRVYFVCGNRVIQQLHEKHKVIQSLMTILSAPQEKLEETANRVLQNTKELEKIIDDLKMKFLDHEANQLINGAQEFNNQKLVKIIFTNRSMAELQQLGKTIAANTDNIIALLLNEQNNKIQLVCSRSKDVNINMNNVIKQVLPLINGKGGGSDSVAQGGGERTISPEELMNELCKEISGNE